MADLAATYPAKVGLSWGMTSEPLAFTNRRIDFPLRLHATLIGAGTQAGGN